MSNLNPFLAGGFAALVAFCVAQFFHDALGVWSYVVVFVLGGVVSDVAHRMAPDGSSSVDSIVENPEEHRPS